MDNEKRIQNYVKQRKATTSACLSFRQKRRIRKHDKKENRSKLLVSNHSAKHLNEDATVALHE
jgi:hypothetical protein